MTTRRWDFRFPALFVPFAGLALSVEADVYGWGRNAYGQLGDGTSIQRSTPFAANMSGVLFGKTVTAIAIGESHTVALTSEGKIYAWGFNIYGQLGDGTNSDRTSPVAVDMNGVLAGKTITAVAAGAYHTLALTSEGKVYAWGENTSGRLGNGGTSGRSSPVAVDMSGALAGKTVTAISAGSHSVALTSEGRVYTWGYNAVGQLGDGTTTHRTRPVAVDMNGALSGKTVTAVSAGSLHTVALTSEGRVFAWGFNAYGQLGMGTSGSSTDRTTPATVNMSGVLAGKTVTAIAAGDHHTAAVTSDGKAYAWGENFTGQLGDGTTTNRPLPVAVEVSGALAGKTVTSVSAGRFHTVALTAEGKAYTWGGNFYGNLGNGTFTNSPRPVAVDINGVLGGKTIESICTGGDTTLALASPDAAPEITVYNGPATIRGAERADNSGIYAFPDTAVGASSRQTFVIKNTGTEDLSGLQLIVGGAGDFTGSALDVTTLTANAAASFTVTFAPTCSGLRNGVVTIVSNDSDENPFEIPVFGRALSRPNPVSGEIFSWGKNDQSQIGDGTSTHRPFPVTVNMNGHLGGEEVIAISAGASHTMALTIGGKLYSWGDNSVGQLGDGSNTDRPLPVAVDMNGVLLGKTITAISAGTSHNLALTSEGKVYSWGANYSGRLGDGTSDHRPLPVAVDMSGALSGKTLIAISAGSEHSVALTSDGKVYAWGYNQHGELGDGTNIARFLPVPVDMSGVLEGKAVTAVAAGGDTTALTSEGKVYQWGDAPTSVDPLTPMPVDMSGVLAGKTVIAISAGSNHTVALTTDGRVYAWGSNGYGKLGSGDDPYSSFPPVAVDMSGALAGKLVTAISAGGYHSTALTSDGKVYSWGRNYKDPQNEWTYDLLPAPVDMSSVLAGKKVTAISAGALHTVAFASAANSPSNLEIWRDTYFPGSTDTSGPGADMAAPQNDGIPNLIKFALGLDPRRPEIIPAVFTANGANLAFNYTPCAAALADGIIFTVEYSDDLTKSMWRSDIVNQGVIGAGGSPVAALVPRGVNGRRFIRLRISRP